MQTRIHKIHHNLDLGEATTFPLILYYVLGHETSTRMSFLCGSPEIPKVETLTTLGAHNFVCRPLIEVRSQKKL
jgi:hypothetical protein